MSRMHNPPHPGEVLRDWIPAAVTVTQAAHELHINRVTLSNLLNGKAGMTANLALRLSAWLGTTPEHWLGLQAQWDLWQARRQPRPRIRPLARVAAQADLAAN
ncbi:HigA protein (antitoxin to HigB) [Paraburkholderia tropica]|uniref:HigA family addiction module antitoxin n=1 Tax=Paraburkholderia TaxID=1822464 RepID=UPI001CAE3842|nr:MULTISPECIES: HigA family addiction module antitoxin [Paraburkholderia]CAG9190283.1 HigA protein (antitoxin to HigB) [Paraburkholderia tropica]